MRQVSNVFAASFAMIVATACGGTGNEVDETGTVSSALTPECDVRTDGRVRCFVTAIETVNNRKVYFRIGANTGPGYDVVSGRHAAVFLFQGTSLNFLAVNNTGGTNGPGATWSTSTVSKILSPGADFGGFYQVATVAALVNAGYTVIQPAARFQAPFFFWDANQPNWNENPTGGTDAPDQILMDALVLRIQPGSTTFGAIDVNHVYAMGISSGGFMSSRIATEYAAGLNADGTVVSTMQPFRAVAIHSAGYANCNQNGCNMPPVLPTAHPPTQFLHDPNDPVVPFAFADNYFKELDGQFPEDNPAYTVNGVREEFLEFRTFSGELGPQPGHQWDDELNELTGDSRNLILQWFNRHR